jgi:hypothetical protein
MSHKMMPCLALLTLAAVAPAFAGDGLSAAAAFDKLKSLEGRWEGHVSTPDGPAGTLVYKVTSAGNTVMEYLFPGSDEEMVSVYYLDGEELVAKHFCAMGNQPEMKFVPKASSSSELHFTFSGGTNLSPAADPHIHGGKIMIRGADTIESEWAIYQGGKEAGANRFFLTRAKE